MSLDTSTLTEPARQPRSPQQSQLPDAYQPPDYDRVKTLMLSSAPDPLRRGKPAAVAAAAATSPASDEPLLSWTAMAAASHTIADFLGAYCAFHGLRRDRTEDLASVHHILMFVEGALYAADGANEARECEHRMAIMEKLRAVLRENCLLSEPVEAELQQGERFWALERVICSNLKMRTLSARHRDTVLDAIRMKSFDYRVLNHVLYALRASSPESGLMQFLEKAELLAEIADDLYDYEADVEANTFNIYRCFLAMYGSDDGPRQLVSVISEIESAMARLKSALDCSSSEDDSGVQRRSNNMEARGGVGSSVEQLSDQAPIAASTVALDQEPGATRIDLSQALAAFFARGREAARDSGGPVGMSGFGNWTFPTPIAEWDSNDGL